MRQHFTITSLLWMASFAMSACGQTNTANEETIIIADIASAVIFADGGSISIEARLHDGSPITLLLDKSIGSETAKTNTLNRVLINGKLAEPEYESKVLESLYQWFRHNSGYNTWDELRDAYFGKGEIQANLTNYVVIGSFLEAVCSLNAPSRSTQMCAFFERR